MLVAVQSILTVFFIPILRASLEISVIRAGQLYFILQISGALGRIVLASVSDRLGIPRKRMTTVCMIFCSLCCILLYLLFRFTISSGLFILPISIITGFFCYGWYGPWITWLAEKGTVRTAGARLGFAMSCNQVSIIVSPFTFGLVSEHFAKGAENYWLITALILLLFWFYQWKS